MEEEAVPYPSVTAEFPGVALERDHRVGPIEEEPEPHRQPEDAAALNAGLKPLVIGGGIDGGRNLGEPLDGEEQWDNDDDVISVAKIPPPPRRRDDTVVVKERQGR